MVVIRLERSEAPKAEAIQVPDMGEPAPGWRIGYCVSTAATAWIVETRPRSAWLSQDGGGIGRTRRLDPEAVLAGVREAGEQVFGVRWADMLGAAAGLSPRSIDKWVQRGELPPPRIVAWLGWVASSLPPEGVGPALALLKATQDPETAIAFARRFGPHLDPQRIDP